MIAEVRAFERRSLASPIQRTAHGRVKLRESGVRVPKEYYVSPFNPVDIDLHFRLHLPDENLRVFIDDYDAEGKVLVSTLTGKRRELTFANLAWFTAKFPFITLKVIWLIHWQAFRLCLKRVPFYWKETRAEDQRGVFRPRKSLRK